MIWHNIADPNSSQLDELAAQYKLHPLHVEDCRHRNQTAKIQPQGNYLFVVLKTVTMNDECLIELADIDVFVGPDYIITVEEGDAPSISEQIERLRVGENTMRADQALYRITDTVVDSYYPILDRVSDRIDEMEDKALTETDPTMLEEIFDLKRAIVQLRRTFSNSRDLVGHILRNEFPQVNADMMPFWRDIYDHLIRALDSVEVHRDLLTGATELYLTSAANRTNQVMKVLTVFGTLATPALIITGIYGMNLEHLPFANHPHAFGIVTLLILSVSALMLLFLRWMKSI